MVRTLYLETYVSSEVQLPPFLRERWDGVISGSKHTTRENVREPQGVGDGRGLSVPGLCWGQPVCGAPGVKLLPPESVQV